MEPRDIKCDITSDGSVIAIYRDDSGLDMLGDLQVTRLSDVEFDAQEQGWKVKFRNGYTLPTTFKDRIRALYAEMLYVEANLTEFGEWVRAHHPESVYESYGVDPSLS